MFEFKVQLKSQTSSRQLHSIKQRYLKIDIQWRLMLLKIRIWRKLYKLTFKHRVLVFLKSFWQNRPHIQMKSLQLSHTFLNLMKMIKTKWLQESSSLCSIEVDQWVDQVFKRQLKLSLCSSTVCLQDLTSTFWVSDPITHTCLTNPKSTQSKPYQLRLSKSKHLEVTWVGLIFWDLFKTYFLSIKSNLNSLEMCLFSLMERSMIQSQLANTFLSSHMTLESTLLDSDRESIDILSKRWPNKAKEPMQYLKTLHLSMSTPMWSKLWNTQQFLSLIHIWRCRRRG